MVPKKSPKSPNIPTDSTMNPINDHFIRINKMPAQKHTVPLILVGREKNAMVRCGPIIKMSPITKRIFPIAKSAASKNANMPTKKSPRPPAVNPTPNSALVMRQLHGQNRCILCLSESQIMKQRGGGCAGSCCAAAGVWVPPPNLYPGVRMQLMDRKTYSMTKSSDLPPSYDEAVGLQSTGSSYAPPPRPPARPLDSPPHRPLHSLHQLHSLQQPHALSLSSTSNYNNNSKLPFNYPSNHFCRKCKNTGFKEKNGKACRDCWDKFYLRTNAYNPNPRLPFKYPRTFFCDKCHNTGIKRKNGLSCKDCWERFSARNNLPAMSVYSNPLDLLFGTTTSTSIVAPVGYPGGPPGAPVHLQPGDPRIGGILCGRCRGTGRIMVFLDQDLCPVCLGLGRIVNGLPSGFGSLVGPGPMPGPGPGPMPGPGPGPMPGPGYGGYGGQQYGHYKQ